MNDWPEWQTKIISLARKESSTRPFLRKVLNELEGKDEFQYPDGKSFCMCTI